jgi:heterodisulfide reductase subunit C2
MHNSTVAGHVSLKDNIQGATGESVMMCYQCGKCSAGCPLIEEMDYAPNQILRMLQLGLPGFEDKILRSLSIWLCLTCETCYSRCPKEVEFPLIMDYLRHESLRQGKVNPKAKNILSFHQAFLDSVKRLGRSYEVGLIVGYKMRSGALFQDVQNAPKLLTRGKLKIFPNSIKNKRAIAKIFQNSEKYKEDKV